MKKNTQYLFDALSKGRLRNNVPSKFGLLPNPLAPPPLPLVWSFFIFSSAIMPLLGETNFKFYAGSQVPNPIFFLSFSLVLLFFCPVLDSNLEPFRHFQTVSIAVDNAKDTPAKCKTCFWGPRLVFEFLKKKHRKNCECCPMSLLIVR